MALRRVTQLLRPALFHPCAASTALSHDSLCHIYEQSIPTLKWQPWVAASALGLAIGTTVQASADAQQEPTKPDPYKRPTQATGLPPSFTLYQYEVCPFCCKVKAMMDYHKLPYTVVEVNPLTKGELKWSTYKKVPVLKWEDGSETVERDSTAIMSRLATELAAAPASKAPSRGVRPVATPTGKALAEEEQWRRWLDERFVKVITANIYRSWGESVDTFKYITQQTNWSWGSREVARWCGAVLMWQVGKGMPAKYNIEGDLREALYADCNAWVDAIGAKRPFLNGASPGLADFAVYGALKAVTHTPTFEDAMQNSRIKPWYDRMTAAIGESARIQAK